MNSLSLKNDSKERLILTIKGTFFFLSFPLSSKKHTLAPFPKKKLLRLLDKIFHDKPWELTHLSGVESVDDCSNRCIQRSCRSTPDMFENDDDSIFLV